MFAGWVYPAKRGQMPYGIWWINGWKGFFWGYEGERRVANEACPNGANTHKACLAAKWLKGFFWGCGRRAGGGAWGGNMFSSGG